MKLSANLLICSLIFTGINASLALGTSRDSVKNIFRVSPPRESVKSVEHPLNDSKFVFKSGDINSKMPVLKKKDNCVAIPNLYNNELLYFVPPGFSLKRDSISRPKFGLPK